jgi:uncharacterized membrane protein YhaH (DUF805 family)
LIVLAASWLVILTILVLDFAGRTRRGTFWRWQGTGFLLMIGDSLANEFAEYRGWSPSRLDTLNWITLPLGLAGLVLVGIGTAKLLRERRKARQAESPGR